MDETDDLREARAMRRAVLGDAYVDGQTADPSPVMAELQDHLTPMAWGAWARGVPCRCATAACWCWR
jgi:4-carboxymuconolactone decarboxylase